jgi:archaellum component FlaF (FlaF/FlaG flagellin family)
MLREPEPEHMATLRHIHQLMNERRMVLLTDGRVGKVVRVDTLFPGNSTTVTVWTKSPQRPGIAKVALNDVVGDADTAKSA